MSTHRHTHRPFFAFFFLQRVCVCVRVSVKPILTTTTTIDWTNTHTRTHKHTGAPCRRAAGPELRDLASMEEAVESALLLVFAVNAADANANANDNADAEAEATLRRHLCNEVVLPRVREALRAQEQPSAVVTASTLLEQGPLARTLEVAGEEMVAAGERCLLAQQRAAAEVAAAPAAARQEKAEEDGEEADDGDTWLGVGGEDGEEGDAGSKAFGHKGKGFVSLFALYDMPDVVLVDMGVVAEKLAQARAGGDVEGQLEGLTQLEGVRGLRRERWCPCGWLGENAKAGSPIHAQPSLLYTHVTHSILDHPYGADLQRALARGLRGGGRAAGLVGRADLAQGM
jgi:hypothetical protein